MYCNKCEKEHAPGAAFCTVCGSPLTGTANAQAAQRPKSKNAIIIALCALSLALAAMLTLSLLGVLGGADKAAFIPPEKSVEEARGTASPGAKINAPAAVREPLPEGSVNETGYYTDELGLLADESQLLPGLIHFYYSTGVQPYVYLTGSINGSSDTPAMDDMRSFAEAKYTELFTDDAHLLLVMFENDDAYRYWYTAGAQAKTVIDEEAGAILCGCLDKYYVYTSLKYEQFFSRVFRETADSIMSEDKE